MSNMVEAKFRLPTAAVDALEEIAQRNGCTVTRVLKEAIALKVYSDRVVREGGKLLTERDDGIHEVVMVQP